jgi:hypothetical protein
MNFIKRWLVKGKPNRVFISYSSEDADRVVPIVQILRATGASVFRDADDIPKGVRWRPVLDSELQNANFVMLFWSDNASRSGEVKKEYEFACEKGINILPVFLEPTVVPEEIKKFQGIKLYRTTTSGGSAPPGGYGFYTPERTVVHPFTASAAAELLFKRLTMEPDNLEPG